MIPSTKLIFVEWIQVCTLPLSIRFLSKILRLLEYQGQGSLSHNQEWWAISCSQYVAGETTWGVETEGWTLELDKSPKCEKLMFTTSDRTSQTQFLPHQLSGDSSKMAEIMHVRGRMDSMKFSSVFSPQGLGFRHRSPDSKQGSRTLASCSPKSELSGECQQQL